LHNCNDKSSDYYRQEKPYLRKDGRLAWGNVAVSLVRDINGTPQFAVGMIEDVTERKQMEAELIELQRRLMEGREAERVHLAQELHDGPVQDLLAFSFNLKAYEINLFGENKVIMQDLQHSLQRVVRTLRSICGDLRPPTLVPFGLEKAIRSHAEIFQEQYPDLHIRLDLMPDGQSLPEQVRLALYRIYQQMLINIVRHAQAKNIQVTFKLDDQLILLSIQDDGEGFLLPTRLIDLARSGHLGIVGAAERAESIGGTFKIDSIPGKGTSILVSVPRKQERKEEEKP
jgi:signal transduction histidine kinase